MTGEEEADATGSRFLSPERFLFSIARTWPSFEQSVDQQTMEGINRLESGLSQAESTRHFRLLPCRRPGEE